MKGSFGAEGTLTVLGTPTGFIAFRRVAPPPKRFPCRSRFCSRTSCATKTGASCAATHRDPSSWRRPRSQRPGIRPQGATEIAVLPRPRPPPRLHRRACHCRPRGHARGPGRARRRPLPHQPPTARRPHHRSLGTDRQVRHHDALLRTPPSNTSATTSATRFSDGDNKPSRGSGSCRPTPGSAIKSTSNTWPASLSHRRRRRFPRHPRWHRLPHYDDQRPRRPRLGRRRGSKPKPRSLASPCRCSCPLLSA